MAISIGNYEFVGPFVSAAQLEEKQGLYAVLHCENEEYELIHLAQADNVRERIELSESAYGSLTGAVVLVACYTPGSGTRERNRTRMVAEIQSEFDELSEHAGN